MRNTLDVCPISFPKIRQYSFDFHEFDRLYDIIRIEIATITAVSKRTTKEREITSTFRWNVNPVKQRSSPSGIEVSLYVKGVPRAISVPHQRPKNDHLMKRESWYIARTRARKIQVVQGTERATDHSTASASFLYMQVSAWTTIRSISHSIGPRRYEVTQCAHNIAC